MKFISDRIGQRESQGQASSDQIGEGQASSDQIGESQASSDQIGQSERQPQASSRTSSGNAETTQLQVEALQGSLVELKERVAMLEGVVRQIADELLAGRAAP